MSPIMVLPETRSWAGSLESFEAYLRSSKTVARFKRDCLERLLKNTVERRLAERQLDVGLQRFQKIGRDPTAYNEDPLFVERCVADLRDTLRHVEKRVWPKLYEIVKNFERVAEETRATRLRSALAHSSNSNGVLH